MGDDAENTWPLPGAKKTSVLVSEGGERVDYSENPGERCTVVFRYVFLVFVGSALYGATIAIDVYVAYEDINNGHRIYAITNLVLVATPSVIFGLYMFCTAFIRFNGSKACCNAILWLLAIPLVPLFPILRTSSRIYHALASTRQTQSQSLHMSLLSKRSSIHLLKFLQALLCSAPQLVLRLHKVLAVYDGDDLFRNVGSMTSFEWAQVGLASASVALMVSLGVGRSPSTRDLFDGSHGLERITGGSVVLALFWWLFFLAARIPCIALLIHCFEYWSLLFLLVHCPFVVVLQTNKLSRKKGRLFFIYLFSAFLFIFVYIEINLTKRMDSAWIPHALFSALALVEQSIILGAWFLAEIQIIPKISIFPLDIFYKNDTLSHNVYQNDTAFSNSKYFNLIEHDHALLSVHYLLFAVSIIFMCVTFCCRSTK